VLLHANDDGLHGRSVLQDDVRDVLYDVYDDELVHDDDDADDEDDDGVLYDVLQNVL